MVDRPRLISRRARSGIARVVLVVAAGCATPCFAQHFNATDAPCRGIAQTAALADCLGRAAQASDTRLNRIYSRLVPGLSVDQRDRLKIAEQRWIEYRDAFCDAEYRSFEGASGGPPARLACVEALTRHHATELETMFK